MRRKIKVKKDEILSLIIRLVFDVNRWHYIRYLCSTHETYIPLYVISTSVYTNVYNFSCCCGFWLYFLFKIYLLWSRRRELRCVLWHMILVKLKFDLVWKIVCRKYASDDVIYNKKSRSFAYLFFVIEFLRYAIFNLFKKQICL